MASVKYKEKFLASGSGVSGSLSFLGSYQVCHSLCMSIVSILAGIGIYVKGMPLLFLQKLATPLWIAAVSVFVIMALLYTQKKMCVSKNTLLFNLGVITAAIPFKAFEEYLILFWIVGGTIVLISFVIFIKKLLIKAKWKKTIAV